MGTTVKERRARAQRLTASINADLRAAGSQYKVILGRRYNYYSVDFAPVAATSGVEDVLASCLTVDGAYLVLRGISWALRQAQESAEDVERVWGPMASEARDV